MSPATHSETTATSSIVRPDGRSISCVTSARSLRSRWPVDVPSALLLILGACGQTTVDSRSAQHVPVPHAVSTSTEPGTCIRFDCPATLNEALRTANSQLCANTKAIGRRTCGDRVEFWVAHGLATESYFYDVKSGALVGSATENDVLERSETGRADGESCSEDCLICGTPNLPMKLCAQANAREVADSPHVRSPAQKFARSADCEHSVRRLAQAFVTQEFGATLGGLEANSDAERGQYWFSFDKVMPHGIPGAPPNVPWTLGHVHVDATTALIEVSCVGRLDCSALEASPNRATSAKLESNVLQSCSSSADSR